MENLKAIRVGDKIIVFINGKRETITKNVSPEVFEMVLGFIKNDEKNKILNLFSSLENSLDDYLEKIFNVKNGFLYNKSKDKVVYSKIIIRKAVQLMGMNIEPTPLLKLANKLEFKNNISDNGISLFKKLNKLIITEEGNLILHSNMNSLDITDTDEVIGCPINLTKGSHSDLYSININEKEANSLILINPFDISSFTSNSINVSRFKVIDKKVEGELKPIMKIENEELFDISYNINLLKNKT
jgi:hypothetical protein